MGVRVVFPDMGKDPSIQLIEKTITENGTYDAITDGANGYSKVNVNVEGGGGSSDFSTARVHIICAVSDDYLTFKGGFWNEDIQNTLLHAIMPLDTHWLSENEFVGPFDENIDFAMLESSFEMASSATTMTGEGNVTVSHDEEFGWTATITGDCTITIS